MTRETTITITTTPKELREIANKMEVGMHKAFIGDECPNHRFCDYSTPNNYIIVRLMADQDAWHSHQSGNQSKWK